MQVQNQEACLQACNECAAACLQCAAASLKEADPKAMARCVALDLECADICRLAAASIARDGEQIQAICALCSNACERWHGVQPPRHGALQALRRVLPTLRRSLPSHGSLTAHQRRRNLP